MARFVFGKMRPHDNFDLVGEVEAANARMEARFPGCTARIVEVDDDGSVAVEMRLTAEMESAACIDWYSADLIRHRVIMLHDARED